MTPADILAVARFLWPFLAGATACGLVAGFFAWGVLPVSRLGRSALALAGLAILAGLAVAAFRLLPERAGLALEVGLCLVLAYALGAAVATALRRLLLRRASADWS